MVSDNDPVQRHEEIDRRRLVLLVLAQFLLVALLMFLPAGDLGWRKGWLFLLVCLAASAVVVPYTWRVNPELLVARSRIRWAKRWDIILSSARKRCPEPNCCLAQCLHGRQRCECGQRCELTRRGLGSGRRVVSVRPLAT
jgi:hypothetical protein